MLENKQVAPAFSVANQENNIIHLADFLEQKNVVPTPDNTAALEELSVLRDQVRKELSNG